MKVEIEELECCLLGPEESELDIRHIVANATGQKRLWQFFRSSVDRVKVSSWLSARRDGRVVEDASGQIYERKAREPCGCDVERKRNLMSEAPEELRKQTPRNQRPGREYLWRVDGTVREKQDLGVVVERREECRNGGRER